MNTNPSKLLTEVDTLLMNALNTINLAGACILTSTEYARELGIPSDRWIYPLGGAGTRDSSDCKHWISALCNGMLILRLCDSLGAPRVLVESRHISDIGRRYCSVWHREG